MSDALHSRLETILTSTRRRIKDLPAESSFEEWPSSHRSFARALKGPGLSVIAEVKRRSPSRGDLRMDLDPVAQASRYTDGGCSAISVLTEPDHFAGSAADLGAVRSAVSVPVLRKDFILDPRQISESVAMGADAILLIVAALDVEALRELLEMTGELGLDALVEVHDEREVEVALDIGATIVGVNNRNLKTFEVDLSTAERLAPSLETVPVTVAESGIFTAIDALRMGDAGFDAVLVGEALVLSSDPSATIRAIRS